MNLISSVNAISSLMILQTRKLFYLKKNKNISPNLKI